MNVLVDMMIHDWMLSDIMVDEACCLYQPCHGNDIVRLPKE